MCQLLFSYGADVDSQDNRKISVLMAAFRKGHIKVIKWLVKHVHQFPSDSECTRFISTISDKVSKRLRLKCQIMIFVILNFVFVLFLFFCTIGMLGVSPNQQT